MTTAKNAGMWLRRVEKGVESLNSAWRCADLRQSNVRRQREVMDLYSSHVCKFVVSCPLAVVYTCFLPAIHHR